jgi:hypothetical protein
MNTPGTGTSLVVEVVVTFCCTGDMSGPSPHNYDGPEWAPSMTFPAANEFAVRLQAELGRRDLGFSGAMPTLADANGREFNASNLAQTCAAAPQADWPRIIGEYLDTFSAVENFISMSPDVARSSLRLRLMDLSSKDDNAGLSALRSSVSWNALPGLSWVLFVRRGAAGQNVLPEHLQNWGITQAEAWSIAKTATLKFESGALQNYEDMSAYIGDSMFSTVGVLDSSKWTDDAERGLFISVPTRHHVMVRKVDAEGVDLLTNFFQLTLDTYQEGPYPLSTNVWWVPQTGPGEYGEQAEAITPTPVTDNADGMTRYILLPGPRLLNVLESL